MRVCWFANASGVGPPLSNDDLDRLAGIFKDIPGVTETHLFTPGATHDPYLHDGAPPRLAMQVYFDGLAALETASDVLSVLPDFLGADFTQQAMLARPFTPPVRLDTACTYLVAYEGTAENLPLWLAHYLSHHASVMTRFPGVKIVEVCTRLDWVGGVAWPRVEHMQRNKVVFADEAALAAALASPVRHEMRADFEKFPPFSGPVSHFPMTTRIIRKTT